MAINPIDPNLSPANVKEVKNKLSATEKTSQGEGSSTGNVSDKVQLSPEALKLHDAQMQSKLADVRGKINSGFYNSEEVLNSVASSLVKIIRGKQA